MPHGKHTGAFGHWLTQYLAHDSGYRLYYDHGDSQTEENVAAIHGFYGEQVSRVTKLAEVDVVVANQGGEVVLLIEIEEHAITPKALLGDLLAILMCNGFAVKAAVGHQRFAITDDTQFILAGIAAPMGSKARKIEEVIAPRLDELARLSGGIDPRNVSLVFERDIHTAIGVLRDSVIEAIAGR